MKYIKLSTWISPEDVFTTFFVNEEHAYWLDSSLSSDSSRFSYMGTPSEIITYSLTEKRITEKRNGGMTQLTQDIFSYLDERLTARAIKETLPFDFIGGYVGYFGYELKALCGARQAHTSPHPDSLWFYAEKVIVFDNKENEIYLVCTNDEHAEGWFSKVQKKLIRLDYSKRTSVKRDSKSLACKLSRNHDQYYKDITACKKYLLQGESYQICLTNKVHTELAIDPLILYQTVRKNNPAPYAAYIKHENLAIICSSPEQFLTINTDRTVETKPIKGTIRRGKNVEEDKLLINELQINKKEWSENAMIVDLLRNDLGKVCQFGTITVSKLMDIKSYETVHQLVSTIKGKLRNDVSIIDCIKACFPGGSMTGVPKLHTMEILDALEKEARGIYSGALGFLSLSGTAKLNVVIRTIVIQDTSVTIGSGGAILIQSSPEKEYAEMILKTKVLMQSISQTARQKTKIFLALGSNVGDKKAHIQKALKLLEKHVEHISVAKVYESKPMYFADQETFNNTVITGYTDLSPEELLTCIKQTEKEIGRIERFRNGPREIDIDILFYDDLVYKEAQLEIPHPRIAEREFVLQPFMDLEPEFLHPVLKKTMQELFYDLKGNYASNSI